MDIKISGNHIVQALLRSFGISLLILIVAFGLMYIYKSGSPLSPTLLLLLIAVSFIVGSAYFDKKGAHTIYAMIGGAIVSAGATFIITALVAGIRYLFEGAAIPKLEEIISVVALLMITSMIALRVVSYKAGAS